MKKLLLSLLVLVGMSNSLSAQGVASGVAQTVDITIPTFSILNTTKNELTFTFVAPTVAGSAFNMASQQTEDYLKVSNMNSAVANTTKISVTVSQVDPGLRLSLQVSDPTGAGLGGTLGTVETNYVGQYYDLVSGMQADIVTGIGSMHTGTLPTEGYKVEYSLSVLSLQSLRSITQGMSTTKIVYTISS